MANETIPDCLTVYTRDESDREGRVSPVEKLMNDFEAHEAKEETVLRHYRAVAATTANPLVKSLLNLIVTDEEKHRALTHAMLATLKGDLTWTRPEGAIGGLYDIGAIKEKLLADTEAFIQLEKEGLAETRELVKETSNYHHGIFALFLRCMMNDTEKHIDILQFLRQKLKEV